jgi:glutamate racemase
MISFAVLLLSASLAAKDPSSVSDAVELRAWRNENVSASVAFGGGKIDGAKLSAGALKGERGEILPSAVKVFADKDAAVYLSVFVPADVVPGRYRGTVSAEFSGGAKRVAAVELTVLDRAVSDSEDKGGKNSFGDIAGLCGLDGEGRSCRGKRLSAARIRWVGQYAAAADCGDFPRWAQTMTDGGCDGFCPNREALRDALEDWRKIRILRKAGQASDILEAALIRYDPKAMRRADEESFREAVELVDRELNRMEGDAEIPLQLAGWIGGRRAAMLDWFRREMYGYAPERPDDMVFDDKGVTFAGGKIRVNVHVSLPEGASRENPAPVFVMGDHYYHKTSRTKTDVMPGMPTNTVTARGYAYVCVNYNDVALNCYNDEWSNKVHSVYGVGRGDDWGTISAWAWCLSRVMDWIETRPELDAKRVAVTGHSRGGKAALWAAAQDRRFAMAVPNGSGTGGARLFKYDLPKAEPLDWMLNHSIKFWYCPNLRRFIGRTLEIPYDADDLIRLVAPRLAYVGSGSKDDWAGPQGEFEAAKRASDLWELYGRKGLGDAEFPRPGEWLHDGSVGYHLHDGPHALGKWDWERFLDFADRHMRKSDGTPVRALDPIGVFDSGVGGMTVLERMLKMDVFNNESGRRGSDGKPDFEGERFVYFGDQANMPYGDYAAAGKSEYLKKLIVDDAEFLLSKKAKAVVIACNTATAWGLEKVSECTAKADAPTVGVIGAGVGSALSLADIASAQGDISIGVMATPGTIASGAYERTILAEAKKRGLKARIKVFSQGCAGLADAVEAGSPEANSIAVANYRELMKKHAAAAGAGPMKAVILGCTHYPFVLSALKNEAGAMTFVDPALATAEECYLRLRAAGRLRKRGEISLSAFISVPAKGLDKRYLDGEGNLKRDCKYGRELGDATKWTDVKNYSAIDALGNGFIRESLPATWDRLSGVTYFPRK